LTIIVAVLIAIACSISVVFLLRNARVAGRKLATDYLILAVTLIGTFVGVSLALVMSEEREQSRIQERCFGILEAAKSTATEAAQNAGFAVATARRNYHNDFDDFRGTPQAAPFEPTAQSMLPALKILPMLLQDTEVFTCLSDPFQEALPSLLTWDEWDFSQQRDLSGFAARLAEAEHTWMHWESLTRYLSVELQYQRGELSSDEIGRELDEVDTWWWRQVSRVAVEIGGVALPDSMLGLADDGQEELKTLEEPN